ncbi:hypothetical protein H8B02_13010 [Bradyrhizobium sp. Pear77]|uniref:hypothetical protein n=1 Tax=Bradyrhizobium altum TaxID=1571202 RepID=UPI001E49EC47|nr:hypothetical protein [Bradyrhizobium altum]MCC8954337.1 hypothetical protein [Bradyrhizobium altum]
MLEKEPLADLAGRSGFRVSRHTFSAGMDALHDKHWFEELLVSGRPSWVHADKAQTLVRSAS